MTSLHNSFNRSSGYYRVGDRVFHSKVMALIESSKCDQHAQWIWHNDVIDQYDWKQVPSASLAELYRARCQQLRDRYDYLALSYSGGGDSDNILRSFINNNIPLDEILVVLPVGLAESRQPCVTDTSSANWHSEWWLTIRPRLQSLSQTHPQIKITVKDWAQDLMSYSIDDDWLLRRTSMTGVYSELRWYDKQRLDRLISRQGALIIGIDKPRICIKDDWYQIYFLDINVQGLMPVCDEYLEPIELFYWSPDTLDLICKQAHTALAYFDTNPEMQNILTWPHQSVFHEIYRTIMRSLIYPDTHFDKFQIAHTLHEKFVSGTEAEEKILHHTTRAWADIKSLIAPRFLNHWSGTEQMIGMINGMWPLKPVAALTLAN